MTKGTGSTLSLETRLLIEQFKEALTAEIEKIKKSTTALKWELRDGRLIGREGLLYLYEFTLDTVFQGITDDSPVMLIAGKQSTKGYIVSIVGTHVMLATEESIGDFINKAIADVQPYWLLEELHKKLDELSEEDVQLSLKCIGHVPSQSLPQPESSSEVPAELNEWQAEAIHLALGNEVSYIWGPPGTGKTKTLAALVKAVVEREESVLVVAHTNVAVDQAVKASLEYLKGTEYYRSGRILRLGTAHQLEVREDENINLDAIVDKRSAPLQELINDLRSRVETEEQRLSSLQQIKERIAKLKELDENKQKIDISLEIGRDRIQDMQKERDLLTKHKTREENLLEHARHMSWLARVVRGINLQDLGRRIALYNTRLSEISLNENKLMEELQTLKGKLKSIDEELRKAKEAFDKVGIDSANIDSEITRLQDEIAVYQREIGDLEKEIAALRSQVIAEAVMIATTITGTYTKDELSDRTFHRLICDETSMVPVPAIFYAGRFAQEAVTVAGDFCQLAPIAMEDKNPLVNKWLHRSVFEEANLADANKIKDSRNAQMLKRQYRMQPQIRQLIGDVFYNCELEDGLPEDNSKCQVEPCPGAYAAIYETSSMNPWLSRTSTKSRFNLYHALVSVELAQQASNYFPPNADDGQPSVSIVVPYRAQFRLTKALIEDKGLQSIITVSTVHRSQGTEKDVIIFDTVDSIGAKVGLPIKGRERSDGARLINVACSRAKYKLAVIANLRYFNERLNNDDALAKTFDKLLEMTPPFEAQTLLPSEVAVEVDHALDLIRPSVLTMDSTTPYSLWRETDFHKGFQTELREAKSSIVILSPFIASKRLGDYFDILSEKIRQGIEVVVATKPPGYQSAGMRDEAEGAIRALEEIGVNIDKRPYMHQKAAIIDNQVVWFGSLNILSHGRTEEMMMRICGERVAFQVLRYLDIMLIQDGTGTSYKVKVNVSKISLKRCKCGETLKIIPKGKFGPFYKCPRDGITANIIESDLLEAIDPDQRTCPRCGKPMKLKRGRNGAFLGCSGYTDSDCRYTLSF